MTKCVRRNYCVYIYIYIFYTNNMGYHEWLLLNEALGVDRPVFRVLINRSENDDLCIKNDVVCIENDDLCIENEEF